MRRPTIGKRTTVTGAALLAAGALLAGPAWAAPAGGTQWRVRYVAGGIGGPGPASQIASRANCAVSFSGGDLYATEFGFVRRISLSTGYMDTPVGAVSSADSLANGTPAATTGLGYACGLVTDAHGNLIFVDGTYWQDGTPFTGKDRVRVDAATSGPFYGEAMTAGHVYTIAGTGTAGFSGDGGPAVDAELNSPGGVAVDGAGNVIVTDFGNDRVRVIAATSGTFYGQAMTAGDIYTIAGNGSFGDSGDGGLATAAELGLVPQYDGKVMDSVPWPVVQVDANGNVVLGDVNNGRVRVIAGSDGTFYGQAMTAGHIYLISSAFSTVSGLALDHAGNILVSDLYNEQVRVIAATNGTFYGQAMTAGHVYTIAGDGNPGYAGDGGPPLKAEFGGPVGLAVDSAGNVVIADSGGWGQYYLFDNELLRVIAARTGRFYGISMKAGDIYTISGLRGLNYYGDGVPAPAALLSTTYFVPAESGSAGFVVTNRSGSVFVTDTGNQRLRMIAGTSGTFFGRKMRAGYIYTIAGSGRYGYSGDNGPATRASFRNPAGILLDRSGNVVVADASDNRVRILAARDGTFYGRAMRTGRIYTIAGTGKAGYSGDGGPAARAKLNFPYGIALDHSGNLVVTDQFNGRVRVIAARTGRFYGRRMRAGDIYTVARLSCLAVAVDSAGNLVLADQSFVRVVAERTGTFYGRKMRAGGAYVVAGDGTTGPVGDGGPATAARLNPSGIALDRAGNILITDWISGRIRVVADRSGPFYGHAMKAEHIYTIVIGSRPAGVTVEPSGAVLFSDAGLIGAFARS